MIWSCGLLPWLAERYFWVWLRILQLPQCTGWLIMYPCANWGEKLVPSPISPLPTPTIYSLNPPNHVCQHSIFILPFDLGWQAAPQQCLGIRRSSLRHSAQQVGPESSVIRPRGPPALHPSVLEAMQCQGWNMELSHARRRHKLSFDFWDWMSAHEESCFHLVHGCLQHVTQKVNWSAEVINSWMNEWINKWIDGWLIDG